MRIILMVVGKTTDPQVESIIQNYTQRLSHYVQFCIQVIPELKNARTLSFEQQKVAEGEAILKAIPPTANMILLDEHGVEYRSVEFADFVQKQLSSGRDLYLVIGGPPDFGNASPKILF